MLSHRLIQVLCNYTDNFSSDALLLTIRDIDLNAPVNIRSVQGPMRPFSSELIELVYAIIGQITMEDYSVKDLYKYFNERVLSAPVAHGTVTNADWSMICKNLAVLKFDSVLHHHMFLQIYNLEYFGSNLYKKGIRDSEACSKCKLKETYRHKLIECHQKGPIWTKFLTILGRILRGNTKDMTCENIFAEPSFRLFPPAKQKFTMWLIAQTLLIFKFEHEWQDENWYVDFLLYKYRRLSSFYKETGFASYYKVLY